MHTRCSLELELEVFSMQEQPDSCEAGSLSFGEEARDGVAGAAILNS